MKKYLLVLVTVMVLMAFGISQADQPPENPLLIVAAQITQGLKGAGYGYALTVMEGDYCVVYAWVGANLKLLLPDKSIKMTSPSLMPQVLPDLKIIIRAVDVLR